MGDEDEPVKFLPVQNIRLPKGIRVAGGVPNSPQRFCAVKIDEEGMKLIAVPEVSPGSIRVVKATANSRSTSSGTSSSSTSKNLFKFIAPKVEEPKGAVFMQTASGLQIIRRSAQTSFLPTLRPTKQSSPNQSDEEVKIISTKASSSSPVYPTSQNSSQPIIKLQSSNVKTSQSSTKQNHNLFMTTKDGLFYSKSIVTSNGQKIIVPQKRVTEHTKGFIQLLPPSQTPKKPRLVLQESKTPIGDEILIEKISAPRRPRPTEPKRESKIGVVGVEDYLFGSKKPPAPEGQSVLKTTDSPKKRIAILNNETTPPSDVESNKEAPPTSSVLKGNRRKQNTSITVRDMDYSKTDGKVEKDERSKGRTQGKINKEEGEVSSSESREKMDDEHLSEEYSLTELEKEAFRSIVWKDGLGTLPGLDDIKFRINRNGLLSRDEDVKKERSPSPEIDVEKSTSDALFKCCYCSAYGEPCDFLNNRFCGLNCMEEYRARKDAARLNRDRMKNREGALRESLKEYEEKHSSSLSAEEKDLLKVEIFRLKMKLEMIKVERKIHRRLEENFVSKNAFPLYLKAISGEAAPLSLFRSPMPTSKNPFRIGWKLEAIDPNLPRLICVVTVVETRGYRIKLHFDDYSSQHDFWVNANSADIFFPGWCERTGHKLTPPKISENFNWTVYLDEFEAVGAPRHNFLHHQERYFAPSGFRVGMKLEAVDKKNTRNICVATIADVIENRILVHIDGTSDKYDYWAENNSPYIHPPGWCQANGYQLQPPPGEDASFSWEDSSTETKNFPAPARAFKPRAPHEFKKGMKLEAVDKRCPALIRVATIIDTMPHQIRIKFDGWPKCYAYWVDDDSPDIHPLGWCSKTGHPLEPTPDRDSISSKDCPVGGCTGAGNAFRKSSRHASLEDCPYSPFNYLREDLLPSRIMSNEEYIHLKEISVSKGTKRNITFSTKPRYLLKKKLHNRKTVKRVEKTPPRRPQLFEKKDVDELDKVIKREVFESSSDLPNNPREWSIQQVAQFVDNFLGSLGSKFEDELIDGDALLQLSQNDLIQHMGIKLVPATTLYNGIEILRIKAKKPSIIDNQQVKGYVRFCR